VNLYTLARVGVEEKGRKVAMCSGILSFGGGRQENG